MRNHEDRWNSVTALVLFVFMAGLALHSEGVAYAAAIVTFVVFRPRRRRLFRPSRMIERAITSRPRPSVRPRLAR